MSGSTLHPTRLVAVAFASLALAATACNNTSPGSDNDFGIGERHRSSPQLHTYATCDNLLTHLQDSLSEEMRVQLLSRQDFYYRVGGVDDSLGSPAADGAESGGGREAGVDYSTTNNQESGVDESDFVKTDGYFIYVINGNRLEIAAVPEFGQIEATSTTAIEGYPSQMLLGDDALVVFSYVSAWNLPEGHPLRDVIANDEVDGYWYGGQSLTKLTVLDITDRSAPSVAREIYIEGYLNTGRRVDSTVRLVTSSYFDIYGLRYWPDLPDTYYELDYDDPRRDVIWQQAVLQTIERNEEVIAATTLDDFVPSIYERLSEGSLVAHSFIEGGCTNFAAPEDGFGRSVTSILSMDLDAEDFAFEADHIVTGWATVYASQNVMLIAEPANDWWWFWGNEDFEEATNIHRFDISDGGSTSYSGSGRIDGLAWDQFNYSEYEGYIRVAATTGTWNRWWLDEVSPAENHVYVLAGEDSLEVVGHLDGIAIGERIWSSRFVGDEGYLVTFQNIDPLWTIDLSDPTNPTIKGELEIFGVSTYIHPIADDRLLTIGYGGTETGLDWRTQLNLFDVSDFSNPAIADTLSLAPPSPDDGWSYAWSEATWEHKAFQYWGPRQLLAIPLSTYRYDYDNGWYEYFSRLQLVSVDAEAGLSLYGDVDHSDFFDSGRYWDYRDVRRSIFMGDFIYAISDRGITATNLDTLELSASLPLSGSGYDEVYWAD